MSPFRVVSPASRESGIYFPIGTTFTAQTIDGILGTVDSLDDGFLFRGYDSKGHEVPRIGHDGDGLQLAEGLLVVGCLPPINT